MKGKLLNLSQFISQDETYNFFGGINIDQVLAKKTYPVWTFTNEHIEKLDQLTKFKNKEIFSILGSADQIIFFLSQGASGVIGCDVRQRACLFGEFKKVALLVLTFEEFWNVFLEKEEKNSALYFEKIRPRLSTSAQKFFDYCLEGVVKNIFSAFDRSGFFYKESWYFAKKKDWLPFFEKSTFQKAKEKANSFFIFNTRLEEAIKYFKKRFDLIYTSNIFDSRRYCQDPEQTLIRIDWALKEGGEILITSQENPKELVFVLEKMGYNLTVIEPQRKLLTLFLKTYAYYYILAKKGR